MRTIDMSSHIRALEKIKKMKIEKIKKMKIE